MQISFYPSDSIIVRWSFTGCVDALSFSSDGGIVVSGAGDKLIMASDTATRKPLWCKKLLGWTQFCVHGGVVLVADEGAGIMMLELTTGHQVLVLPSIAGDVSSICIFDGSFY